MNGSASRETNVLLNGFRAHAAEAIRNHEPLVWMRPQELIEFIDAVREIMLVNDEAFSLLRQLTEKGDA